MPCDLFLMKKWLKSEICGSHALFMRPTRLIKEAEKSTIYGYYLWTVAVCPPKCMCSSTEKKKKKKKRRYVNAKRNNRIQTHTRCEGPRTKERFDELLSSLLRHHKPKEGIHLRMWREETRDFWEVQMSKMRYRKIIMVSL